MYRGEKIVSELKKVKVTAPSSLNIREVPGGDILMEAKHNAVLTVLDWDGDETWARVQLEENEGYTTGFAMKEYLEFVTEDDIQDIAIEEKQKRAVEKESGMFANIGEKIKSVTVFFCVMGIALSILAGIILMMGEMVGAGLLTAVVGSLGSYLGAMAMYGFGELITETKKQSAINEAILQELRSK